MSFKHTVETDARIRKGYEEGERVSDIGKALGVTKNTIIGRARRLGLAEAGRQLQSPFLGSQTPEGRARIGAASARRWLDPDFRAIHQEAMDRLRSDPEKQAKIMAALHAGRDRYNENRKANHSANRSSEPAQ